MAKGVQARDQTNAVATNVFEWSGPTQVLTVSSSATATTAYSADTVVRLYASADCHYKIGTNPTATANDVPIAAKAAEQLLVRSGNKISVFGTATVSITEAV